MSNRSLCRRIAGAAGVFILCFATAHPGAGEWVPEYWVEESDEATDLDALLESYSGPLMDINRVSRSTLESLDLFSGGEVDGILSGRPWASVGEARKALEVDPQCARIMEAIFFVAVPGRKAGGKLRIRAGRAGGARLPVDARVSTRLKTQVTPRWSVGLVQEKDPGESNAADHAAGYVEFSGPGRLRQVVVGDYTLRFGQGILFGADGPGGMSIARITRENDGGRGFSGTGESGFQRGALVCVESTRWATWGFFSLQSVDARTDGDGTVTGFPVTGYHRTEKERGEKDRCRVNLVGGRIVRNGRTIRSGITLLGETYSSEVCLGSPDRDGVRFQGDIHRAGSFDWRMGGEARSFFGEVTLDRHPSYVAGFAARAGVCDAVFWVRRLDGFLYSPHGALATVGRSVLRNEKGAVFGLRLRPQPAVSFTILADLESRPWRTWTRSLPPRRSETRIEASWDPENLEISGEWKIVRSPDQETEPSTTVRRAVRIRLRPTRGPSFSWDLKESVAGGSRGTLSRVSIAASRGRIQCAATLVCAWLEPGAASLYAYAASLPGEMRFMQASSSGSGGSLSIRIRFSGSTELGLHCERSRFRSRNDWFGVQIERRI